MPKHITPPLRQANYDAVDIMSGTNALRAVMPRGRDAAVGVLGLVGLANLEQQLLEEVLMRLLYADEVRRRRDGKVFVYWATTKMPSLVSVPLTVPDRLRHFMVPPSFTTRS
jgi:hypothetical protein